MTKCLNRISFRSPLYSCRQHLKEITFRCSGGKEGFADVHGGWWCWWRRMLLDICSGWHIGGWFSLRWSQKAVAVCLKGPRCCYQASDVFTAHVKQHTSLRRQNLNPSAHCSSLTTLTRRLNSTQAGPKPPYSPNTNVTTINLR